MTKIKIINFFLGIVCVCLCLIVCRKTAQPPIPVTLQFDVYNHTQGYITSFIKPNVMSGDNLTIKISWLMNMYGVRGVDERRIALFNDGFSGKIFFTRFGYISLKAPRENKNYDIVLFNALEKMSYDLMDLPNAHLYEGKQHYVVYRKDRDGVTGPEDSWQNVFNQLNSALDLGWVKWGSITRRPAPNDEQGDIRYGYAICFDPKGRRVAGLWGGGEVFIDPEECRNEIIRRSVGLEEAFEQICLVEDIGGDSSHKIIQNLGVLNQTGKDLFVYVFVKDSS